MHGVNWFCHFQSKCANTLKKNKKGMAATWSDHDSKSSDEDDSSNLALSLLFLD